MKGGLRKGILERFVEQGYTILYFSISSALGLTVMSRTSIGWFNTSEFWSTYPMVRMDPYLKAYYLIQSSYWTQQALMMLLKVEKPRADYLELVAHHIVTLWMSGWSYAIHLTYIGVAVYVTMDIPDAFFAMTKSVNYFKYEMASNVGIVIFLGLWSYFRLYQNFRILWSVWNEFDLIPDWCRYFRPSEGVWMAWWMKYQIFVPIFLLLCLNLFWYYLIWRIIIRMAMGVAVRDDREDEDDDEKEEDSKEKKE